MIKKQSIWFLTLFSIILVLGVYYVTMPNEVFLTSNNIEKDSQVDIKVEENEHLVALEVEKEEERSELKLSLESILNDAESTSEAKNDAYLKLKSINEVKGQEEALVKKIKNEFKVDSFVKIDSNNVNIVVIKNEHDISLANKIMNSVKEEYEEPMIISVKFEK